MASLGSGLHLAGLSASEGGLGNKFSSGVQYGTSSASQDGDPGTGGFAAAASSASAMDS